MTRDRKIWLITDTHFNHAKMIEKGFRPRDFEGQIVMRWNELVMHQDLVIHLGDLIIKRPSELEMIMELLHGTKVLVKGNHDNESIHWYMHRGFNFACDGIQIGDIWLTHEPAKSLPSGCVINVHGHLHSDGHRDADYDLRPWHCLLSLEATDYKPVELFRFVRSHKTA